MQYHYHNGQDPCHPAGESRKRHLRVDFDRRLKLEFHGSKITSDAGLLAYRELDHALGLTGMAGSILTEARRGKNIRHMVEGLFRQSAFGRLAGYEDVNDAERLSLDPAMRTIVNSRGFDRNAASTSEMARFDGMADERGQLRRVGRSPWRLDRPAGDRADPRRRVSRALPPTRNSLMGRGGLNARTPTSRTPVGKSHVCNGEMKIAGFGAFDGRA